MKNMIPQTHLFDIYADVLVTIPVQCGILEGLVLMFRGLVKESKHTAHLHLRHVPCRVVGRAQRAREVMAAPEQELPGLFVADLLTGLAYVALFVVVTSYLETTQG